MLYNTRETPGFGGISLALRGGTASSVAIKQKKSLGRHGRPTTRGGGIRRLWR